MLSCGRITVSRCSSSMKWRGSSAILSFSQAPKSNSKMARYSATVMPIRLLSTKDLFGNMDSSVAENLSKIPVLQPPKPRLTVDEMVASGQSVLTELDLWTWWKPSSYFRWALESIHIHMDIPWWGTIIIATCALRLALVFVPIMSHRMVGKQQQNKKELDEFKNRIQDAKSEGNSLLVQQIFLEQRNFMLSKGIRMGRQLMIILLNASVFTTQFFAIKKMLKVGYPGLSTGGLWWFTDLTVSDPYYILPVASAVSLYLVTKIGIEFGTSANQMGPGARIFMQYCLPGFVLVGSSQFSSAISLYWVTSNVVSLIFAGIFHVPAVKKALNIPIVTNNVVRQSQKKGLVTQFYENRKATKDAPPRLEDIKKKDAENFKKAGRGQPAVKVGSG